MQNIELSVISSGHVDTEIPVIGQSRTRGEEPVELLNVRPLGDAAPSDAKTRTSRLFLYSKGRGVKGTHGYENESGHGKGKMGWRSGFFSVFFCFFLVWF